MADDQERSVRTYTILFSAVGAVMVIVGFLGLFGGDNALLAWVIIACGVFNIGLAVLFHVRRG